MNPTISPSPRRVAVIGGGISGLAAAHRLIELDPALKITLFESASRLGGTLHTVRRDGFLIEQSADNFLSNVEWGIELCRRVGLGGQLVTTDAARRKAFVVRRGRLVPIPAGFTLMAPSRLWPMLTTPLLSPWGKLRLAWEYFVPARRRGTNESSTEKNNTEKSSPDESLASFVRRRLGRETFERLVQPLVGGIYTADPERLSMAATMPRFLEMERRHGGLLRGARPGAKDAAEDDQPASGARYSLFVAPRDGMSSLVDAIAARLPSDSVRLNTTVQRIELSAGGWRLTISNADQSAGHEFDSLVIAVPAHAAARLLGNVDAALAAELAAIEHASSAVVSLGYRREQIGHPLDGFGFVVPAIENRRILAGSFASVKFPGRAPDESVLIRVFLGGACQSEVLDCSDDELAQLAAGELAELLDIRGAPILSDVARWNNAMPQYHVGHLDRVARIEARAGAIANFALAGNAYRGVGIPNCIHSGQLAAEQIARNYMPAS